MARAVVPLNFNVFLEKAKLKDDGSNYTDWVRNLRIILIVAQKNYVLNAPLGVPLITHKYRGSQQFSRVEYSTQIY